MAGNLQNQPFCKWGVVLGYLVIFLHQMLVSWKYTIIILFIGLIFERPKFFGLFQVDSEIKYGLTYCPQQCPFGVLKFS